VVETLLSSFPPRRRLLVFAGSGDKDLAGMFQVLAPHFAHALLTRYSNNPRAVAPERLAEMWRAAGGLQATVCPTPAAALEAVRGLASADDLICITGSVFLAGQLRPLLVVEGDEFLV
jgi:dihydrofolate synthase/folylpolyglutamate synthase